MMSYILAPTKEMLRRHCQHFSLTPLRTGFAYAHAHILSYAELTLAYAHHSFAYATPLQGPFLNMNTRVWNVAQMYSTGLDSFLTVGRPTKGRAQNSQGFTRKPRLSLSLLFS